MGGALISWPYNNLQVRKKKALADPDGEENRNFGLSEGVGGI
jgi:hypothetical protein